MCDTDDTDALLVARPDPLARAYDSDAENRFAETVVRKLDSLRSRLENLESASTRRRRFEIGSHTFPKNVARRRRKPVNRPNATFAHLNPFDRRPFSDIDALSETSFGDSSSMDSDSSTPQKNVDNVILKEVESFLDSINRFESESYFSTPPFRRPIKLVNEPALRDTRNVSTVSKPLDDKSIDDLLSKYIYLDNCAASKRTVRSEPISSYENVNNMQQNVHGVSSSITNSNVTYKRVEHTVKPQNNLSERDETRSRVNVAIPSCSFDKPAHSKISNYETSEPCTDHTKRNGSEILTNINEISLSAHDKNEVSNNTSHFYNSLSHKEFRTVPTLSQLWNDTAESKRLDLDSQKLEEEKMRRQHCETVIHELQRKHLEHQQKLAVAVEVDSVKEGVILKLKQICKQMSQQLYCIENNHKKQTQDSNLRLEQSQDIIQKLNQEILKREREAEFLKSSINRCNEQTELLSAENETIKTQTISKIEEMNALVRDKENHLHELKESNNLIVQLNKQVSESFEVAKNNLTKAENENAKFIGQVNELKLSNEALENEISTIRSENADLSLKFGEEQSRNIHLESQKNQLQKVLDEAYKKIDLLESEFNNFKGIVHLQKLEMKSYYQKEVENIVKNKVNEFQNDLDAAKVIMADELQNREKDIALQFAKHLYKVEQQHENEVHILEEKHKEQSKLYKIQLNKSNQSVLQLEEKLLFIKNKRGEITKQLHNVMENQWQQAFKIINHTDTSGITNNVENKKSQAIAHTQVSSSEADRVCDTKNGYKIMSEEVMNENIPTIDNEQLQHYLKILLQKMPNVFGSHIKELSPPQQKFQEDLLKSNSMVCNQNPMKQALNFEYPTTDKIMENSDKKSDRNTKMKRPWK